jgi:hypothetical protein
MTSACEASCGDAVDREALERLGPQIVGEDLAALPAGEVAAHRLAHHAQADKTELVHRSSRRRSLLQRNQTGGRGNFG